MGSEQYSTGRGFKNLRDTAGCCFTCAEMTGVGGGGCRKSGKRHPKARLHQRWGFPPDPWQGVPCRGQLQRSWQEIKVTQVAFGLQVQHSDGPFSGLSQTGMGKSGWSAWIRVPLGAFCAWGNIGLRNRVGQAVSGYVFLLNLPAGACLTAGQQVRKLVSHQSVLPFSPRKPGGEGCGHISPVPTTYPAEKCVWKVMPVALL